MTINSVSSSKQNNWQETGLGGGGFQEPPGSGQDPHHLSLLTAEDMRVAVSSVPGIVSVE